MEPIAVVGFSFRLPQGAEDEDTFWDLLEKGKNVMTEWPESRAHIDGLFNKSSVVKNTVGLSAFCAIFAQDGGINKEITLMC